MGDASAILLISSGGCISLSLTVFQFPSNTVHEGRTLLLALEGNSSWLSQPVDFITLANSWFSEATRPK